MLDSAFFLLGPVSMCLSTTEKSVERKHLFGNTCSGVGRGEFSCPATVGG